MNLADLSAAGFDVLSVNHAEAVMVRDFAGSLNELCDILARMVIRDEELIRGGGGESSLTQRLRQTLSGRGWRKRKIVIQKTVDGKERASTTHEIDHVRETEQGSVALEIEWNNKDPFYDRDLENFQRLHVEGAISVGIILTRGQSLQRDMRGIVLRFARARNVADFDDLADIGVTPTQRQRRLVEGSGGEFAADWARVFVADKFGWRRRTGTSSWNACSAVWGIPVRWCLSAFRRGLSLGRNRYEVGFKAPHAPQSWVSRSETRAGCSSGSQVSTTDHARDETKRGSQAG